MSYRLQSLSSKFLARWKNDGNTGPARGTTLLASYAGLPWVVQCDDLKDPDGLVACNEGLKIERYERLGGLERLDMLISEGPDAYSVIPCNLGAADGRQ